MSGSSAGAAARRWALATLIVLAASACTAALLGSTWPRNAALAALMLVPVMLPLAGLLRGDRRTYAWATLCVAPYFVYGVTETVANPAVRVAAATILFASLAHFVALVAYLRVTRPAAHAQATSPP